MKKAITLILMVLCCQFAYAENDYTVVEKAMRNGKVTSGIHIEFIHRVAYIVPYRSVSPTIYVITIKKGKERRRYIHVSKEEYEKYQIGAIYVPMKS